MKIRIMNENLFVSDFPKKNLSVVQDKNAFCFGLDAVLLSDFAVAKNKSEVFDLGTGNGIIPLLMSRKYPGAHFTALEIQKCAFDLAVENANRNNLAEKINVINCDIKSVRSKFPPGCANVVTSNPPYAKINANKKNLLESKNIARHEVLCNLDDVISAAAYLLKSMGSFFMIHRPDRLAEIFSAFEKYKLEPKKLQLVHPFMDASPTMVLIEGRKNANPELKILPPLIVYESKGEYTETVKNIYGQA